MPRYLYRCDCGEEFFVEHRMTETPNHMHCDIGIVRMVLPSPGVISGKDRRNAPPSGNRNSWERGVATDHRGVPYKDNGSEIPVKKFSENRRKYEARIRELRNSPNPF